MQDAPVGDFRGQVDEYSYTDQIGHLRSAGPGMVMEETSICPCETTGGERLDN